MLIITYLCPPPPRRAFAMPVPIPIPIPITSSPPLPDLVLTSKMHHNLSSSSLVIFCLFFMDIFLFCFLRCLIRCDDTACKLQQIVLVLCTQTHESARTHTCGRTFMIRCAHVMASSQTLLPSPHLPSSTRTTTRLRRVVNRTARTPRPFRGHFLPSDISPPVIPCVWEVQHCTTRLGVPSFFAT